jgi:hypothetical protein
MLLTIICLLRGHDLDLAHVRLVWPKEDVFYVYPYQVHLCRCRRCHRYVKPVQQSCDQRQLRNEREGEAWLDGVPVATS